MGHLLPACAASECLCPIRRYWLVSLPMLSAIVRPLKIYAEALSTVDSLVIGAQAEQDASVLLHPCLSL